MKTIDRGDVVEFLYFNILIGNKKCRGIVIDFFHCDKKTKYKEVGNHYLIFTEANEGMKYIEIHESLIIQPVEDKTSFHGLLQNLIDDRRIQRTD